MFVFCFFQPIDENLRSSKINSNYQTNKKEGQQIIWEAGTMSSVCMKNYLEYYQYYYDRA